MMSQLYNLGGICYNNNCLGHSFFLAQDAVFLFDNIVKRYYLNRNRACAVNKLQRAFGLDIQSTGAVFAFVPKDQIQTERPTQMLGGESEPLERSIEMSPTDDVILSQNDPLVNSKNKKLNTEIWKPIPDFPGYEVSTFGSIRSYRKKGYGIIAETPQALLKSVKSQKHAFVHIRRNGKGYIVRIHRLVTSAFLGPCPSGLEVCHNDGNPQNNHIDNLRYDTHKANIKDKQRHGTQQLGENVNKALLTNAQANTIRYKRANGITTKQLSEEYGVSVAIVRRLVRGKTYTQAGYLSLFHAILGLHAFHDYLSLYSWITPSPWLPFTYHLDCTFALTNFHAALGLHLQVG